MRAVDVLPLVPVRWIAGYARCGLPNTSMRSRIFCMSKAMRVKPRPLSAATTSSYVLITHRLPPSTADSCCGQTLQGGRDPGQVGLRGCQPVLDLGDHGLRRLADERLVAEFGAAL